MALSQSLQQKLLQKLSPQQIQLMKLLQVPTANLEERIKEELEENPALELDEEKHEDSADDAKDEFSENGETEVDDKDESPEDYNEEDGEAIIQRIQHFDPPGVAARDLQECLILQLQRQKNEGKNVDTAMMAIKKYFDEFTKKHYEKIQRGLGIDEDQLKEVMQQII